MKSYTITVNGNVYQVTVEEGTAAAAPAAASADGIPVKASVPGKIVRLEKTVGDSVNAGDTVLVLEAMKMEIPVVAPESGKIASFQVSVGDSVESGDILATLS